MTFEDIKGLPLDFPINSAEFEVLERAALNGSSIAQHNMGIWYEEHGDVENARKWYEKAKLNGHDGADEALQDILDAMGSHNLQS